MHLHRQLGLRRGGAVCNQAGQVTLTHCTLDGNSATIGGGIFTVATLALTNCIVAGNTAQSNPDISANIFLTASGANLIGNNSGVGTLFPGGPLVGISAAPLNPLLAPLGSYGGPTATMALLPGSPARDAAVGSTATADQRGFPIVGTPDLGAYEAGTLANFNAWSAETTGSTAAFGSDLNGDGIAAGLEYALHRDPLASGAALLPTLTGPTGAHVFTFRYRAAARDLRYIVQRSSDLTNPGNWVEVYRYDSSTGQITETGVTADENAGTEIITLTDPSTASGLFWRLLVQQVP